MKIFDEDFRELLSSHVIAVLGGLIAGILLASYEQKLLLIPGLFILLPGFLEMRGNISGSFAARLTSGLFLGVVDPCRYRSRSVRGNLFASFILVIFVSFLLGFLAFLFNYFVFSIYTPKIILIALFAGLFANIVEIPLTLFATFYLFRRGHDPNNIMGPFITSTGDVTSIIALLIALVIV